MCGDRHDATRCRFPVSLEGRLGAGAIVGYLPGSWSPGAEAAADLYRASANDLDHNLRACAPGGELIARGFEEDVLLASERNVSEGVPILVEDVYVRARGGEEGPAGGSP